MKNILAAALCAILLTSCVKDGEVKADKVEKKKQIEMAAWLVYWDPNSIRSYVKNAHLISRVCPEWYTVKEDGMPYRLEGATDEYRRKTVEVAKKHGIKVLALMGNYANEVGGFDKVRVQKFLNDKDLMKAHIEKLIQMAKEDGADGLDVDYESLEHEDRGNFTRFVTDLGKRAKEEGLLVGIAVHPKTSEPGNWGGPMAQDWRKLGAAVDYFRPMCYDNHWSTSAAGAVAPPDWADQVMRYAATLVPPEKLEMGIPSYGYDWKGQKGETVTWDIWQKLQAEHGKGQRDRNSRELTLTYGANEVWYCDAESLMPKFKTVKDLGLAGVAMWRLGSEDPSTWRLFEVQRYYR